MNDILQISNMTYEEDYDGYGNHEFGEVVGISDGTLVVNSPSGTVEFVNPEKAVHLTVMPF